MQDTPKTGVLILSRAQGAFDEPAYKDWHRELVVLARQHEGLLDVDLQTPIDGVQDEWVQVITFDTIDGLKSLLDDERFKTALTASDKTFGKPVTRQVVANSKPSSLPVTVVISQQVKPGCEAAYQKWQQEIDSAARKFPGFQATELISPLPGVQNEWVVIFRFDSSQNLDDWFASETHQRLMKQAEPFFENVQVRRIGRGFEDWFANASGDRDGGPSQIRMAMVVLLALYPTVMLLTLYVSPLMSSLGLPLSIFVSNILSVILLTWAVMPITTRALRFWLDPETGASTKRTVLGTTLVLGLYAISILVFSQLTA
ncbi:antibiotic biosynthesis monooxygenase [Labrenzia sp. VG12]|uniref:antibiotic biosynthesis monooxygenase n=1 Tax=Labrenzia sp. VG12 TaxID=2021862 RepID=UPI000B8C361E|nr:antibiotic biosynthesis monooxygenase [Labrenzia sp. VG12]ASP32473.1 hypothetical protein CHH27_03805 [Labrenzia sp. VG12]